MFNMLLELKCFVRKWQYKTDADKALVCALRGLGDDELIQSLHKDAKAVAGNKNVWRKTGISGKL